MINSAKQAITEIWNQNQIRMVFGTNESFDAHLKSWSAWINKFSDEDYADAVASIRNDIVEQCRGSDLDRPSLQEVLRYAKAANRRRASKSCRHEEISNERKAELREIGNAAIGEIRGLLSD